MTRLAPKTLLINGGCLLVLVWLYGGDLLDAVRARSAEVSAFSAPPTQAWPALVVLLMLGALGVGVWGLLRGRTEDFKGYRLLPILLVCALFFDLVLAESKGPLNSVQLAAMGLRQFQTQAQALARDKTVATDPALLRQALEGLGQPPYLVRGERARAWSLQVRSDCTGPVREAPGLEVGTFLYCVSKDRTQAWVSLVALPWSQTFGPPSVFSVDGEPYAAVVQPPPPEPPASESFSGSGPPPPGEAEEPAAPAPRAPAEGSPAPTP